MLKYKRVISQILCISKLSKWTIETSFADNSTNHIHNIQVETLNMVTINNHIHTFTTYMFSVYDNRDICQARILEQDFQGFLK